MATGYSAVAKRILKNQRMGSLGLVLLGFVAADLYTEAWERFQTDYNRSYLDEEVDSRFEIFKSNIDEIIALNEEAGVVCEDLFDGEDCAHGINKFADYSQEEFARNKLGYRPRAQTDLEEIEVLERQEDGGSIVDWRGKAITAVKDQGDCGSCWAFSAVQEIESSIFMATGKLPVPLSTQQIISCDKDDNGCDGGDPSSAYEYVMKAGGLDSDKDYPDTSHVDGKDGKCKWDKKKVASVKGHTYAVKPCQDGSCTHQDEDGLAAALASKGPISICVNAQKGWQSYKKGILAVSCPGKADGLDHAVQVVGYNKAADKPYWIVRNSWNTDWGVDGFIYLPMGHNACGIADEATFVATGGKPPAPSPSPPSPSPSPPAPPAPGCKDVEDFCHYPDIFNPKKDCKTLASSCLKTCGCCVKNPPKYCSDSEQVNILV